MDIGKLNRIRVADFEEELQSKIDELETIEEEIVATETLRNKWLERLSVSNQFKSDIYDKKLEVIKAKAELSALHMTQDVLRLESIIEKQSLDYLVFCVFI
jgi:hypothetical protein